MIKNLLLKILQYLFKNDIIVIKSGKTVETTVEADEPVNNVEEKDDDSTIKDFYASREIVKNYAPTHEDNISLIGAVQEAQSNGTFEDKMYAQRGYQDLDVNGEVVTKEKQVEVQTEIIKDANVETSPVYYDDEWIKKTFLDDNDGCDDKKVDDEDDLILGVLEVDNSDLYDDKIIEESIIKDGYLDATEWMRISTQSRLSESFMRRHANDINWALASRRQHFSPEFVDEHFDLLDHKFIVYRFSMPVSYLYRLIEKYGASTSLPFWKSIETKQNIDDEFYSKYSFYLNLEEVLKSKYKGINSISDKYIFDNELVSKAKGTEVWSLKQYYEYKKSLENE